MPIAVPATREALAVEYSTLGDWISLHTGDPGTTGADEASGGGYAREQTTWSAGASDGEVTGTQVEITAAADTYTHIGINTAVSAGTFRDSYELPAPVVLTIAGTVKVTPTYNQT